MGEQKDTHITAASELPDEVNRLKQENAELRARLADLESIITMMPVAIAISRDATVDHVEVNPAFAALLGTDTDLNFSSSAGPIRPDKPYRLLRNGKPVTTDDMPLEKATRTAQEIRDELEIVRDDSIRYHIYGFARPLFDSQGAVRRAFAAFVDVSERKRAEKALEQSVQALRNANAELQQFAYAASHDLQEPLRTIASYTQLLERRHAGDQEASEFTGFIVEGVQRMNTLIHDLLMFSRVGAGEKLRRTPVMLRNAVQFARLNLDRSIKEENATITEDDLPEVVADETQMVQLFQNLISNSLKYKSEHPPRIHIGSEDTEDEWVITVRDNGIGIEPQYHTQVFGVFKRLHGRDIPGTGIGLAICRKIVETHGGRIWIESDGKAGSAFRFTLPK